MTDGSGDEPGTLDPARDVSVPPDDGPHVWETRTIVVLANLLVLSVLAVLCVTLVQGVGAGEVVPTNPFRSKVAIFYVVLASGSAVAAFRSRREGMDYFLPAEIYEDHEIESGPDGKLREVRQTSWSNRSGRSSTYSSISLGLILVVALLFVANREEVENTGVEALFVFVILIASVSVVLYGVSLQLWDEVLGEGYLLPEVLRMRRNALVLSSLGWITLVSALGLAVITVHSPLGAGIGLAGVVAGLYVFEHKWRLAHRRIDRDIASGPGSYLRRLWSGGPPMGARARRVLREGRH